VPATPSTVASCEACDDNAIVVATAAVGTALAVLLLLVAVPARFYRQSCQFHLLSERGHECLAAWREQLRRLVDALSPHVKLKILLGFYLIATQVDRVYEIQMPYQVKQLLRIFSIIVSLGIEGIGTPLACLNLDGYQNKLVVYMTAPIMLTAIILAATAYHRLGTRPLSVRDVMLHATPALMKLAFLAYPLVTNVAFEAFPCHEFKEGDGLFRSWLRADVEVECGTAAHGQVVAIAVLAIIVYPIGLLVLCAALLVRARAAIRSRRETALSRAIAFLWRDYEPHMWWWELVEMLRRFVLVGLMQVVVEQGSSLQVLLGMMAAIIFLLFQVQANPYLHEADDYLGSACSFCLTAIFVCSVRGTDPLLSPPLCSLSHGSSAPLPRRHRASRCDHVRLSRRRSAPLTPTLSSPLTLSPPPVRDR